MNLSEAFAMVEVTPSMAITILNSLAEGHTDRDPGLSLAINTAIQALTEYVPVEPSEEPEAEEKPSSSEGETTSY